MTKAEFAAAVAMAQDSDVALLHVDTSAFWGCGLPDFDRIAVTLRQCAAFIRWQCQYLLSGGFDAHELQECAWICRKRVDIVGDGSRHVTDTPTTQEARP